MEGSPYDLEYADELASWILEESEKLDKMPIGFKHTGLTREKIYQVSDISKKHGTEKFLLHAVEFCLIWPKIFALSDDLTRCKVRGWDKGRL